MFGRMEENADFTVAMIGFLGVLLGGIIQTGFAWRKARNDEAQDAGPRVTDFQHRARVYLIHLAKIARMQSSGDLQKERKEVSDVLQQEMSLRYRAAVDAGLALASIPDSRVALRARQVTGLIEKLADLHDGLFGTPPRQWPPSGDLPRFIEELLDMVAPAIWELRF
ncbi:hypothetical protein QFZ30_001481 [Arthrobacter pascens]|uniref:hypothetical protein n=1 Tax=Arthrobacter pascens TaxID=1677 RepID=UPI00278E21A5|nr:hypothetical protein [Arthrobacter pascens]MDQ0678099.1 hypothetical protein [Arthrobacter pascens]